VDHSSLEAAASIRFLSYWRKMKLERLPEDRHDEAVRFLADVFPGSQDAPFLNRELRHWKYYQPHPFGQEPRCYVFRDAEGLTAHGGLSPVEYSAPGGVKTGFQVIDWAGAPRCPGAGFMLFRALWPKADCYLGIGGSADAKRVMRRIPTIRQAGEMAHYAHPLRPWGQLTASPLTWKSPAKFARSWRWRLERKRFKLDAWKAVPVDRLSEADAPLLVPAAGDAYCPLRRVPDLVNYWLACPAGHVRAWRLEHSGRPVGLLALNFMPMEVRVVDLVINTPSAPLAEAFSLAIDLAARQPDVFELSAASSAAPVVQAMGDAGMIPRGISEVFLGDPGKSFPPGLPIEANLTIGDGFYLQVATPHFYTY
jgi:hypothetical protein